MTAICHVDSMLSIVLKGGTFDNLSWKARDRRQGADVAGHPGRPTLGGMTAQPNPEAGAAAKAADRAHVFHSWSAQEPTDPLAVAGHPGRPTLGGMTAQPNPEAGAAVKAADRAHVFHSWSAQELIDPLAVAGAQGSYFWDYDGRRYLDFASALVYTNIGYQHPKVVTA